MLVFSIMLSPGSYYLMKINVSCQPMYFVPARLTGIVSSLLTQQLSGKWAP